MRNTKATQEAVWAAADRLGAEGVAPTFKRIEELIGGSHTTIAPHLKTWHERQDELKSAKVPEQLKARGDQFLRELFSLALCTAQQQVEAPLQVARAALQSAKRQLADAEVEVGRLEQTNQHQADEMVRQAESTRAIELSLAAQQAVTQEKVLAVTRLEAQLEQAQRSQAEAAQEVAELRASAKTAESFEGRLETLQRSVQGLANGRTG